MRALDGNDCEGIENEVEMVGLEDEEQGEDCLAIQKAVRVLLQGLGEDINREGLKKTPFRVAKALLEATMGYGRNTKEIVQGALFPEASMKDEGSLVIVQNIDIFAYCESCMLPFQVRCHIGWVPLPSGDRVVGLSKFSRVACVFAKRLQHPQRLADEISAALHHEIKQAGVCVMLQCSHIPFPNLESLLLDSSGQGWVKETVCSGSGVFENEKEEAWVDFFGLMKIRASTVAKTKVKGCTRHSWCPSITSGARISSDIEELNPGMVAAVTSIIRSLGEDPLRKELVETPSRFVKWLMNFKSANLEMKLNGFVCCATKSSGELVNGDADGFICSTKKSNGNLANGEADLLHTELNLTLWSQCEHHLLPFYGAVHIGYFCPEGFNRIGRAILQSVVYFYGFKLQVQERLGNQIADTIAPIFDGDVMVVVEATHMCMTCRGVEKIGSSTASKAVRGRFQTDIAARARFYERMNSDGS